MHAVVQYHWRYSVNFISCDVHVQKQPQKAGIYILKVVFFAASSAASKQHPEFFVVRRGGAESREPHTATLSVVY